MRIRKAAEVRSSAGQRNGIASKGDEQQRKSNDKHCEGNASTGAAWPGRDMNSKGKEKTNNNKTKENRKNEEH